MRRTIVTGCAGFVGSELTRRLLARGSHVTGIDDLSRGTRDHLRDAAAHPRFRFVRADILAADELAAGFTEGADDVFHLAARHFIPECVADPAGTYAINVVGSQRVWDAAARAGARRFVLASTGDVYAPSEAPHRETDATVPFNAYGLSKLVAEQALSLSSAPGRPELVIARLFNVYGPGETNPHLIPVIIEQVRRGARRLELGHLWPVRDFIFVRDVAEALLRLVEAPAPVGIVNIGTGGGWSVAEIVALIGKATATDLTAVSVPERCRPVERHVLRPETTRLTSLTGWRPAHEFVEGLRETYEAGARA